jgi:hypothetical protein
MKRSVKASVALWVYAKMSANTRTSTIPRLHDLRFYILNGSGSLTPTCMALFRKSSNRVNGVVDPGAEPSSGEPEGGCPVMGSVFRSRVGDRGRGRYWPKEYRHQGEESDRLIRRGPLYRISDPKLRSVLDLWPCTMGLVYRYMLPHAAIRDGSCDS